MLAHSRRLRHSRPIHHPGPQLFAEPLRIGVIWFAFGLLACGYAHGGPGQLAALELRRLDAADGAHSQSRPPPLSPRSRRALAPNPNRPAERQRKIVARVVPL